MTAPTTPRAVPRADSAARRPRRRPPEPVWLTIRQAETYSGFGDRALRLHIKAGNLRAFIPRGSRVIRIDKRDLDDFLSARDAR